MTMELRPPNTINTCWSSMPTSCSMKCLKEHKRQQSPRILVPRAAKNLEKSGHGLQKSSNKNLAHILRTEAAILRVERKADSRKYTRLWPKAVLEALDDAIKAKRWQSALKIFDLLRKQHWYEPKGQTYTKLLVMLGKCRQPNQASLLFEIMLSEGLQPTIDVYTALLSAYGFSGLIDKAFQIIEDIKSFSECKLDVHTYSVLINCCFKYRRFDRVEHILQEMSYLGIQCSTVTYNTIIDGYGKAQLCTCLPDVFTFNSVVGTYGNCGQIEKMEKWFDEFQHMGVNPDIITFNILIQSYGKAGMYEKMSLVMEFMEKRFVSPTIVTFNIVINVFRRVKNIDQMEEFFLKMKHQGLKPNSITYCTLISAYSEAGLMHKVDSIMRQVENTDVILDTPFFNSAITAYGRAGNVDKMRELFSEMRKRRCLPDNITFSTMIEVYNALNMVEAAQELESKMISATPRSGIS
ncbi:hypothetical protein DCAR_0518804 [Daucus carota subsp. sativus]|uniref:Pentacotripeptide-repeat region of PRORP domain-containing protein n=1 Tax=Daucus carota subsp. sativus TaxID=79200 RepID=A0AAF1B018_DAUCS|nr:hypothetical protein DCAR_0518804 [Daucus carota subsp. sativus]